MTKTKAWEKYYALVARTDELWAELGRLRESKAPDALDEEYLDALAAYGEALKAAQAAEPEPLTDEEALEIARQQQILKRFVPPVGGVH